MRVVLDTNVLLSACLKPDGLEAQVVDWAIDSRLTACVTPEVWREYEDVLFRPKFLNFRPRAEALLAALGPRVVNVIADHPVSSALDEDDNRFLECAEASNATYLITGNLRHYPAEHGQTRIVNARGFITTTPVSALGAALK